MEQREVADFIAAGKDLEISGLVGDTDHGEEQDSGRCKEQLIKEFEGKVAYERDKSEPETQQSLEDTDNAKNMKFEDSIFFVMFV